MTEREEASVRATAACGVRGDMTEREEASVRATAACEGCVAT